MWIKNADLWETSLLVALLSILWLVIWRRMGLRSARRRRLRRDRPPPENGEQAVGQTGPSPPPSAPVPPPRAPLVGRDGPHDSSQDERQERNQHDQQSETAGTAVAALSTLHSCKTSTQTRTVMTNGVSQVSGEYLGQVQGQEVTQISKLRHLRSCSRAEQSVKDIRRKMYRHCQIHQ